MIQKVNENALVKPNGPMSQRDHIRADIEEAERNGVGVFELVGDYYNYDHLSGAVREVLREKIRKNWWKMMQKFSEEHVDAVLRKYNNDYKKAEKDPDFIHDFTFESLCGLSSSWVSLYKQMFTVKTMRGKDRTHVYVKADWDMPKQLYEKGMKQLEENRKNGKLYYET